MLYETTIIASKSEEKQTAFISPIEVDFKRVASALLLPVIDTHEDFLNLPPEAPCNLRGFFHEGSAWVQMSAANGGNMRYVASLTVVTPQGNFNVALQSFAMRCPLGEAGQWVTVRMGKKVLNCFTNPPRLLLLSY